MTSVSVTACCRHAYIAESVLSLTLEQCACATLAIPTLCGSRRSESHYIHVPSCCTAIDHLDRSCCLHMETKAVRYSSACNRVHRVQQDLHIMLHASALCLHVALIGSGARNFCRVPPESLPADVRAMHSGTTAHSCLQQAATRALWWLCVAGCCKQRDSKRLFSHGTRCLLPVASCLLLLCTIFPKGYTVTAETPHAIPSLGDASAEAHKPEQLPGRSIAGHPVVHAAHKVPAQNSGQETASKVSDPLAAPVSFDEMLLTLVRASAQTSTTQHITIITIVITVEMSIQNCPVSEQGMQSFHCILGWFVLACLLLLAA